MLSTFQPIFLQVLLSESPKTDKKLEQPGSPSSGSIPPVPAPRTTSRMSRNQSPIYRSIDSDEGPMGNSPPEEEGIYEPPPGMKMPPRSAGPPPIHSNGIYSESELESSVYGGTRSQIYSSRAPSRCSSISATQSFDMRMYGQIGPGAKPGKGEVKPSAGPSSKGNEDTKEKLENPYYYYGSTRNQKKYKQHLLQQKHRPLLPSQRLL